MGYTSARPTPGVLHSRGVGRTPPDTPPIKMLFPLAATLEGHD